MASNRVLQDHFGIMLDARSEVSTPQLWPMAMIISKIDLTAWLSRWTLLGLLEKWPICISYSKLCEQKIFPPSFRVPFLFFWMVNEWLGGEIFHESRDDENW